jgi:hypothetical protein
MDSGGGGGGDDEVVVTTAPQSMSVDKMLAKFEIDGVVESNSPKNRKKLYMLLANKGIPIKTTVIGYTTGTKWLCRSSSKIGWDLKRVAKWISHKRITSDMLREACYRTQEGVNAYFDFDAIADVFNGTMTRNEIVSTFEREWGDKLDIKFTPFDYIHLKKTIVRIERV